MNEVDEALQPLTPELEKTLLDNRGRFLRFLEKRAGRRDVAEEILQSAFVRALEHSAPADPQEAVTWFYRVLRNALIDHYRRTGHEAHAAAVEAQGEAGIADPELRDAVCACVGELVPTLKPEYADIVRRVDLEGTPVAEVARQSGITANNAGVRLHRARQALMKRLESSCGACSAHGCLECNCAGSRRELHLVPRG